MYVGSGINCMWYDVRDSTEEIQTYRCLSLTVWALKFQFQSVIHFHLKPDHKENENLPQMSDVQLSKMNMYKILSIRQFWKQQQQNPRWIKISELVV